MGAAGIEVDLFAANWYCADEVELYYIITIHRLSSHGSTQTLRFGIVFGCATCASNLDAWQKMAMPPSSSWSPERKFRTYAFDNFAITISLRQSDGIPKNNSKVENERAQLTIGQAVGDVLHYQLRPMSGGFLSLSSSLNRFVFRVLGTAGTDSFLVRFGGSCPVCIRSSSNGGTFQDTVFVIAFIHFFH